MAYGIWEALDTRHMATMFVGIQCNFLYGSNVVLCNCSHTFNSFVGSALLYIYFTDFCKFMRLWVGSFLFTRLVSNIDGLSFYFFLIWRVCFSIC